MLQPDKQAWTHPGTRVQASVQPSDKWNNIS